MKLLVQALCIVFAFLGVTQTIPSAAATTNSVASTTWYVRADGGTRYTPERLSFGFTGQCDGQTDAPYSGDGGSNEHCAFNDWRFLYDDQAHYNSLSWVIRGGDTVIIDNNGSFRVGYDTDGSNPSSEHWCWGSAPYSCFNPALPPGNPTQHTRILGRNFASCNVGNLLDKTKLSHLYGGHGVSVALNLADAQYVDVECMEITRHSQCIGNGQPTIPAKCQSAIPLDDYDANGMWTGTGTHDLFLQDIWDHGHTSRGIIGPIGGLVATNRVDIDTNGMAGWDFDDGNSTASVNGVLKMAYTIVEWSGCNQEYPAVHAVPVISCYGQSTAGYGDGIGTPAGSGMDAYIDHSTFRYNTQDGPDFVHVDTGNHVLAFTNNRSYGNSGAALKFGVAFKTATITNNVLIANCTRLSAAYAGVTPTYNANLQDFCRAFNGFGFGVYNGNQVTVSNNTFIGYAPTMIDPACGDTSCAESVFTFTNNIVRGYDNPATYNLGGKSNGPGLFCGYQCDNTTQKLGTFIRDHNLYFGTSADRMANTLTGYATNETATNEVGGVDPIFVNEPLGVGSSFTEAELDNYNTTLSDDSPAAGIGASTPYSGTPITTAPTPPAPTAAAPFGYVEFVAGSSSGNVSVALTSTISISGWAVEQTDLGPARSVQVFVDGVAAGSVIPSLPRPDVAAYTGKALSLNSGWSLNISASTYGVGTHLVSATATDSLGQIGVLGNFAAGFTIPATVSPVSPATPTSITVVLSDGSIYKGALVKQ